MRSSRESKETPEGLLKGTVLPEENKRRGKATNLKKTGDIQGMFQERIGMIKDRHGKDLRKTKEIRKRWQE